jgi:hypothetical protein
VTVRTALVAVIALSTLAFVVGSVIERNSGESHARRNATESANHQASGEQSQNAEGNREEGATGGERATPESAHERGGSELKPLGIDTEAAPFVALGAIASLALVVAAWRRPQSVPLLALIALAMVAFAALDVQEVVHQSDEGRTGLAILAAFVAGLHLTAAGLAAIMIRDTRRSDPQQAAAAGA